MASNKEVNPRHFEYEKTRIFEYRKINRKISGCHNSS